MKDFLLREECFGGTLFSVNSGKRVYVDRSEFQMMEQNGVVPPCLNDEIGCGSVKIVYPKNLPEYNFSFPDTIFMELTRSCNISCKHCFNNSGRRLANEMEAITVARVIMNIASLGAQEVRLTGGEPLVLPEIFDLIKEARGNNLRVSMGTNATLVTHEMAARLYAVGLQMAVVSVDGLESTHDAIRGKGNFRRSIAGIRAFMNHGIKVRVNIVAMRSNLNDISELTKLFHKMEIEVFIRRFISFGRAAVYAVKSSLNSSDYGRLREVLAPYTDDEKGNTQGHYIKEKDVAPRINIPFERRKCSAMQRGLVITPNGDTQICGFISCDASGFLGNVQNESLDEIWKRIISGKLASILDRDLNRYNQGAGRITTNCYAIAIASADDRKEE